MFIAPESILLRYLHTDKPWTGDERAWRELLSSVASEMGRARADELKWNGTEDGNAHGVVWGAMWGALAGAGSVLLVAGVLLMWKRPRSQNLPTLAPMDVGKNVRIKIIITIILFDVCLEDVTG
ncbi:hypothetical protein EVAR_34362_1 [Eumeta japonica]|uniref:Uncharacterized protein n=1 Tax=Eumeta variegata TaxID=151549 RepID=A0A4C1ZWV2_EUMVA|nr:hypothetical protein EVAR_34362_1 [Eumeta japonica]